MVLVWILCQDQQRLRINSAFHPAEVARVTLERCCERLSKEIDAVKDSRFSISRRSAKMKANGEIVSLAGSNFEEVTTLVEGLETGWRDNHPNV
jgi:hypothetical protein